MEPEATTAIPAGRPLRAGSVYALAVVSLLVGLAVGYIVRGSPPSMPQPQALVKASLPSVSAFPAASASSAARGNAISAKQHGSLESTAMPSMVQMKQIADKQAAPLLEKLKNDPKDVLLLSQIGAIYHSDHQFKEAATYYEKGVEVDPKNVAMRSKLATSLYRSGDVDGAITQLNEGLTYDPKDANSLFNLGMIKLNGKRDGKGALAAWQRLLKSNPQLSADRKATVQHLIADLLNALGDQAVTEGAGKSDGHKPNLN